MTSTSQPARRLSTAIVATVTALAVVLTGALAFGWTTAMGPQASVASAATPEPTEPAEPTAAPTTEETTPSAEPTPAPLPGRIRNVVFILADDLDWELFRQVPRLNALQQQGLTFTNQTVTNSLCCPSRVSILRGQYVHNHRVISNLQETGGGWPTYRRMNEEQDSLPVWVKKTNATTGFLGKYLNQYPNTPRSSTFVPPGWDTWAVGISRGASYAGYNYQLNRNGKLVSYGDGPNDFMGDVLTKDAVEFVKDAKQPFFLHLSLYAPHKPFPTANRHLRTHSKTIAPRTPLYNSQGVDSPQWLKKFPALSQRRLTALDKLWRERAQSAESIADSIAAIQRTLRATGRDKDTLLILTSDNGYHVATRHQPKGKRSPYAEDTVVPMVMIGPGIVPGTTTTAMTSTIDLAPTITELMGGSAPRWVDGRSLVPFIRNGGQTPDDWRTGLLSQSLGESRKGDPDYEPFAPPMFNALRTQQWLYTEYATGETELYDLANDPYEQVNIVRTASPTLVAQLRAQLDALRLCRAETCRVADRILPEAVADPEPEPTPPPVTPPPVPPTVNVLRPTP